MRHYSGRKWHIYDKQSVAIPGSKLSYVGNVVGVYVGTSDGSLVGILVGQSDGLVEGNIVGSSVGNNVGYSVGWFNLEGLAVGSILKL